MSIDAITAIPSTRLAVSEESAIAVGKADNNAFVRMLVQEVQNADQQVKAADDAVRAFAVGETDNLHHVMMSITKAQTSFELAVQVRNRLVEGFQEVMRMPI